jgi:hypothetical protein
MLSRHPAAASTHWSSAGPSTKALMCLLAVTWLLTLALPLGAQTEPSKNDEAMRREQARLHFERGVGHFDRKEWQAAAVEFLASRELFVTKANTKDAAICLRKIGRYDEALSLFEALLTNFADLPASDRELATREVSVLVHWVGTLDVVHAPDGARVTIDGVERGTAPLAKPLRLAAGTHVLRVIRDGFLPLEVRVDVPGGKRTVASGRLARLTRAGRLRVVERAGRALEVVVDGTSVGSTPWEGALAPGSHTVWLRGPAPLGTPPSAVRVPLDQLVSLELTAVSLYSTLAVQAEPPSAEITLDGVRVGRGRWQGRLTPGGHRLAVEAPGYEALVRTLNLSRDAPRVLSVELDPIGRERGAVAVALETSAPFAFSWGGALEETCRAPCSSSLPLGGEVQLRATYAFASGLGLGAHVGYMGLWQSFRHRAETFDPVGRASQIQTVQDQLALTGFVLGGHAEYAGGERWRLAVRVQAGAFLGTLSDRRRGTFVDSMGSSYLVDVEQVPRARYLYVGPELAVGRRFFGRLDVMVGARLLAFAALREHAWDDNGIVGAGGDGAGYFRAAKLSGDTLLTVAPTLSVGYVF